MSDSEFSLGFLTLTGGGVQEERGRGGRREVTEEEEEEDGVTTVSQLATVRFTVSNYQRKHTEGIIEAE